jgi:succinate dehydrogenase/fumarate reductase flavoprotein subunit
VSDSEFDVVVAGAGIAGYTAATFQPHSAAERAHGPADILMMGSAR